MEEEEECPQVVVSAEYHPLILLTCDAVEPFRAMQIKPKTELDYAGYPTPLTLPYTTLPYPILPYPPSTLLNLSLVHGGGCSSRIQHRLPIQIPY